MSRRPPSLFRQSDIARLVRAAIAGGLKVVGVKVSAQGDIEVVTAKDGGESESKPPGGNEWDAALK